MFIIVFSLTTNIFSQVKFASHTIVGGEYEALAPSSVYAEDLDGDGDMDVLSASDGDDKIAWYENDGNENFTPYTITVNADGVYSGFYSVYAVDVDGDGDIDVLSAAFNDNKIAWYENMGFVGIVNNDPAVVPVKLFLYNNYPNPFNPSTTFEFDLPITSFVTLQVYNSLGEEVEALVKEKLTAGRYKLIWNAEHFASGIYFYRLISDNFIQTRKMMLIR
jgi:hypothetical protein